MLALNYRGRPIQCYQVGMSVRSRHLGAYVVIAPLGQVVKRDIVH
jgi:hypothetical protein